MNPPKSSVCVICGIRPATTKDHIPPRGFFKGISGQFRKVPACSICNNGSSDADEALRNLISAQIGKQTTGAKILWEKGAHQSLLKNTRLRSDLINTIQEVEVVNENGEITKRLAFEIPVSLYQRIFERVTRGLYFWHTRTIFPIGIPIQINLLSTAPNLGSPEMGMFESHSIADDAFEYRFAVDPNDSRNSIWIFSIHKSHWVQSSTGLLVKQA